MFFIHSCFQSHCGFWPRGTSKFWLFLYVCVALQEWTLFDVTKFLPRSFNVQENQSFMSYVQLVFNDEKGKLKKDCVCVRGRYVRQCTFERTVQTLLKKKRKLLRYVRTTGFSCCQEILIGAVLSVLFLSSSVWFLEQRSNPTGLLQTG